MQHAPFTSVRCAVDRAHHHGSRWARARISPRRALSIALFAIALIGVVVFVLPQVADLGVAWERAQSASGVWLALAVALEAASFAAYFALFHAVFRPAEEHIGWRESYLIPMASVAAGRVVPGAGAVALMAWALRRAGMAAAEVARRVIAFLVVLDGVYLAALALAAAALALGLAPGAAPAWLTTVPALIAVVPIVAALALLAVPSRRLGRAGPQAQEADGGRRAGLARRVRSIPATVADGERDALAVVRSSASPLLAAVAWWGLDIATLWACFSAFGEPPPAAVIVVGYFVGQLASVLPLPGGIGGVEGGMFGAFIGFGVEAELALVAVLVYRALAYWLPTLPGIAAYFQLRRTIGRWDGAAAEPAPTAG